MDAANSYGQNAVGKIVNRDVLNDHSAYLVRNDSFNTHDHDRFLKKHGVELESRNVSAADPYTEVETFHHHQAIEETVARIGLMFEEVRKSKKVPLSELRTDVIPMIHEVTLGANLFDLMSSLQAKDDYTYRHNIAVGAIATLIGQWMKLDRQELLQLTTAALLHDVGKMLIPAHILNKPEKLTPEEYRIMKGHTVLGYKLLKDTVGVNHRQALVALQHHERMDGSGYPFGVTQQKIDQFSRIVSVADMFHAMTSQRVYRTPSPFYEVLDQMDKDAFGALDPAITRLFIEKIMNGLIGRSVLLTDEREGTIRMIHMHDPLHPLIQVGSSYMDLSKDLSVRIQKIL